MGKFAFHKHRMAPIRFIRKESSTVRSLIFNDQLCAEAKPGQFSMVWVPGIDEIPMSLTVDPETSLPMIVVKRVGEATNALHRLRPGDLVGVRGPFGTCFRIEGRSQLLIAAGGTGIVPMLQIALKAKQEGYSCDIVLGAKGADEILFLKSLRKAGCAVYPITEDGSLEEKGLVLDIVKKRLEGNYDLILCCGPELMIKSIFELALEKEVDFQTSLERMMKCGVGICGSCELCGFRVCREGPVFNKQDLKLMGEAIGQLKRSASGRQIKIDQ